MHNRDWSLVLFTTFSQWSVGIILCITLLGYFDAETGLSVNRELSIRNPVLLALVLVGVAMLVSFLHLGTPSNAPKALNNLSGSWLSREILAMGVYLVCLLTVLVLGWINSSVEYLNYVLLVVSVAGLVFLWMMARIYMIPTIPPWNSWYTPVSFVSAALCLGLLTFLIMDYATLINAGAQTSKMFAVALIVILFVEIVWEIFRQFQLKNINTGIDKQVFDRGNFSRISVLRTGMLIFAFMAILIIILVNPTLLVGNERHGLMYLLFALVAVQEFIGRLLFYSSYFRIGV